MLESFIEMHQTSINKSLFSGKIWDTLVAVSFVFLFQTIREFGKAPGAMFPGNMVMGMAPGPPALNGQNGFVMQPGGVQLLNNRGQGHEIKWDSFWWDQTMRQMLPVILGGFPVNLVHCLDWCHIS